MGGGGGVGCKPKKLAMGGMDINFFWKLSHILKEECTCT